MLGEIAPGLAMEVGMDDALSEVMNKLLEQGFEGAMRLAKHRGADKVELKDMARYIGEFFLVFHTSSSVKKVLILMKGAKIMRGIWSCQGLMQH